ncbi:MAG: hypothetical protein HC911_17545 [Chloroflexaceae bacterium]|nr:hypothetical protein [Chloroflexaceae bacterium]
MAFNINPAQEMSVTFTFVFTYDQGKLSERVTYYPNRIAKALDQPDVIVYAEFLDAVCERGLFGDEQGNPISAVEWRERTPDMAWLQGRIYAAVLDHHRPK